MTPGTLTTAAGVSDMDALNRSGLAMLAEAGNTPWGRNSDARDALDRPLPNDWLQACAQAREARLIIERRDDARLAQPRTGA